MTTPEGRDTQHAIPHPKRRYAARKRSKLNDEDSTIRLRKMQALSWSLPGGVAGALGGGFFAGGGGLLAGFVVGFLVTYLVTTGISEGSGTVAGKIYHPSGGSTPVKHEYSYAESLAARGRYQEAVTAYEVGVSEFPEDPEPYIRIARVYRDRLHDYEMAVHWFKRARKDPEISKGQELLVTQELIEIYRQKLGTPTRAIPELARMLDRFPEDQVADWARGELARLREQVAAEESERAGD